MTGRRFAISDIHACNKTFMALIDQLKLTKDDQLFILGDLIDRGPDSKGVIDNIMALQADGFNITVLMGNHEDMMVNSDQTLDHRCSWILNGGKATLDSFGIDSYDQMDQKFKDFFDQMHDCVVLDKAVLVHAGLQFLPDFADRILGRTDTITDPITQTPVDFMLWSRDFQYDKDMLGGRMLICGHTPQPLPMIESLVVDKGLIIIDNGCVFSKPYSMDIGNLVALDIDSMDLIVQKNID